MQQLAIGNDSSERVLFFSDVIVIEWFVIVVICISYLSVGFPCNYDVLMQEAIKCDRAMRSSRGRALGDADIFHRLYSI